MLLALTAWAAAGRCAAFDVQLVQIPIDPAVYESEPALANAETWQLQVTTPNDLLYMEIYMRVAGGEIFQVPPPLGSDDQAADSVLIQILPQLAYDSYTAMPHVSAPNTPPQHDYAARYDGPIGFTQFELHSWRDSLSNVAGVTSFPVAQVTYLLDGSPLNQQWIARFFERSATNEIVEHFYATPGLTSPFGADVNLDFQVDGDDLADWAGEYGQTAPTPLEFDVYDLDNDGDVDDVDVSILVLNFGSQNASPEQGDVNGTGSINSDDYKLLVQLNSGYRWSFADVDQNLHVDGADFLMWQRQLGGGFTIDVATGTAADVPEPDASLLSAIAWFAGLALPRRIAILGQDCI